MLHLDVIKEEKISGELGLVATEMYFIHSRSINEALIVWHICGIHRNQDKNGLFSHVRREILSRQLKWHC